MATEKVQKGKFWGTDFLRAGLNLTDNAIMISFSTMVEAVNILVGKTWARRKRGGMAFWATNTSKENAAYPVSPENNSGTNGDPIIGLYEWWRTQDVDGTSVRRSDLMVRQADKLWAIPSRTTTALNVLDLADSGSDNITLPTTGKICFAPFYQTLYWCSTNPNEGYNKWEGDPTALAANDGEAATGPESNSTPKFIFPYRNRMVAGGVFGFEDTLYLSEVDDAETWVSRGTTGTTTGATSLLLDQIGDPVGLVGGCTFQKRIYAFMRRVIYEINGDNASNFVVDPVVVGIGAINHHCILPIGDDVYFLSERGLLSLKSTDAALESEYGFMSRDISTLYTELLDHSNEDDWEMEYLEDENLILITCSSLGSTTNDTVLVYNTYKKVWTTWSGINARSMTKVLIDNQARVAVGREDGRLAVLNEASRLDWAGEDAETPINAQFLSGIYYPGDEVDIEHVFKYLTILCSARTSASITVTVDIDSRTIISKQVNLNNSGDLLGSTFTLGSSVLSKGTYTPKTIELKGQGYGLQVRVTYNANDDVEVYGFLVGSVPAQKRSQ